MNETLTHDKISLLRLAFQGLDDVELQEMAELTEFHTYPANHVLCLEGANEDVFYIVADGNIVISKLMGEGEDEKTLRLGGRGDMVGEMALIQNAPRAATVRTTTECTVLEMEKQDFETILSRSPHMAIDIIRITLDRVRSNDKTVIENLQKTNKVLRQLDRNKMEFIQVAAHELRTPLTVLNGYVKVLQSAKDIAANTSLAGIVDGIVKGTQRIHGVVNLMLDVTRIDADDLKVASVPVPYKHVIDDVVKGFKKALEERNIRINIQHAQGTPSINGDPALIQKALYQLIINAIKYTPDGELIIITTRPVKMTDDSPGVEIAVRDSGIGLDVEHHELVFEKFYQVGSVDLHSSGKTAFKGGGPGVGLAIVKGVARAHGGKAWVESAGRDEVHYTGSTFYLQLPLNA
ncbi:MAG TPA: ATP-binding protein [Anaerolineales bacterium]|nr:ATP-binding protein [Anaerolineales bacterium]